MVFYAKKTLKIALWRHKNDQWRHKICPSDVILEQNIFWTFCEHVYTKTKTLQEVVSELCPIELKHIHKISRKSLTSQLWPPSPDPHMGPNFLKPLLYDPKQKSRNLQKISSRYVNNFKSYWENSISFWITKLLINKLTYIYIYYIRYPARPCITVSRII